jgi:cystathionine beta-lyase
VHKGYAYARGKNPTRVALERCLAELENAKHGLCFSSGMGAADAIIKLLVPGDEVIATDDLYGGSYRMFTKVFAKYGIVFHFVDMHDFDALERTVNAKTKMLWVETPTNPMMKIIDIEKCVEFSKKHNLILELTLVRILLSTKIKLLRLAVSCGFFLMAIPPTLKTQ